VKSLCPWTNWRGAWSAVSTSAFSLEERSNGSLV
jgi:hypothetical protein